MQTTSPSSETKPQSAGGCFLTRLKQDTAQMHASIEKESFFFRMGKGEISQSEYVTYLQCMWRFTRVLEARLATQNDAVYSAARAVGFPLSTLIEQDLHHFGTAPSSDTTLDQMFASVRSDVDTARNQLLGYVYLIGGSQHGASFMAKSLQKTGVLGAEFEGGAYLRGHGLASLHERWPLFLAQLQKITENNTELQNSIIEAVQKGYGLMHRMSQQIATQQSAH